jgi:hypothetical protein
VLSPGSFSHVAPVVFAVDRIDTWVLKVSIGIPVVCIVALALWHVIAYLSDKLTKKPKALRQSPEPLSAFPYPPDDPERQEQACAALEHSLVQRYVELGESWLRKGQSQKAATVFNKVLQICPEGRQAALAQERLRQIGEEGRTN